jgi:hypothetical protein
MDNAATSTCITNLLRGHSVTVALSSSSEENPGFGLIDQITAACGFTYLLGGTDFGAHIRQSDLGGVATLGHCVARLDGKVVCSKGKP